jgi:hypothetical protein
MCAQQFSCFQEAIHAPLTPRALCRLGRRMDSVGRRGAISCGWGSLGLVCEKRSKGCRGGWAIARGDGRAIGTALSLRRAFISAPFALACAACCRYVHTHTRRERNRKLQTGTATIWVYLRATWPRRRDQAEKRLAPSVGGGARHPPGIYALCAFYPLSTSHVPLHTPYCVAPHTSYFTYCVLHISHTQRHRPVDARPPADQP